MARRANMVYSFEGVRDSAAKLRGEREQLLGLREMRLVEHATVKLHGAGTLRGGEGVDHALCRGDFLFVGREGAVDHIDLVGMDGDLSRETGAACGLAVGGEPFGIAEICPDRVDRGDARGRG